MYLKQDPFDGLLLQALLSLLDGLRLQARYVLCIRRKHQNRPLLLLLGAWREGWVIRVNQGGLPIC